MKLLWNYQLTETMEDIEAMLEDKALVHSVDLPDCNLWPNPDFEKLEQVSVNWLIILAWNTISVNRSF